MWRHYSTAGLLFVLLFPWTGCLITAQDTLDKLVDSFGSFIDSLAGGDECQFKCANGRKPSPRPGHISTANGCGSFGLQLDTSYIPDMRTCCDDHDKCYDTCNSERDVCDDRFKDCLEELCHRQKKLFDKNQYKSCLGGANLMYVGTMALGCTPYKEAQAKACSCGPRRAHPEL